MFIRYIRQKNYAQAHCTRITSILPPLQDYKLTKKANTCDAIQFRHKKNETQQNIEQQVNSAEK